MKRNGMCPACYIKKLFTRPQKITNIYTTKNYDNKVALTPPMGWSSWNSFKNNINQDLIYDTAVAMKESGLRDAGYTYINIDDNWHSSLRDENGELQGDLTTFSNGIPTLIEKINKLGLKVGIYSSNGTLTCEDLPASLYNEKRDALTIARWGVEYFKYDFCHNIPISKYAPLVYGITLAKKGESDGLLYLCDKAKLEGMAKYMPKKKLPGGKYVSGLDANCGALTFDNVTVDESGEYVLSINIFKKGGYEKFLMAIVNDNDLYSIHFPSQRHFNLTAKFQVIVKLKKGINTIKLFNPVRKRADSAMIQYQNMSKVLTETTKKVALETGQPDKPIVFSICEWGRNQPYKWGRTAGNSWRTTGDIRPYWPWMKIIYNINVKLHEYAGIGGWNDPDMLEVGNGNLSYDQNVSHFSLWCMMCAPLILGNDLRKIPQNVLDIVTNKNLIAINQDALGVQAKRIIKGKVDVLVKPLADGGVALCLFNKANRPRNYTFDINKIIADGYANLKKQSNYSIIDLWEDKKFETSNIISSNINKHGVKVYKIV